MNKEAGGGIKGERLSAVREMGSFNESGIQDTHTMVQLFGNIKNPFT